MGRVGPGTCNDWNTFVYHTNDFFDHLRVFTHAQRRSFACCTYSNNTVGAFCNMPLNELLETLPIYAAIFKHGGDDCDNGTLNGLCLLSHFKKLSYLSIRRE